GGAATPHSDRLPWTARRPYRLWSARGPGALPCRRVRRVCSEANRTWAAGGDHRSLHGRVNGPFAPVLAEEKDRQPLAGTRHSRAHDPRPILDMRYLGLACDYDGTIAHDGVVAPGTLAALTRLRESGRRLILVTGRELDSLMRACARLDLFDRVVA